MAKREFGSASIWTDAKVERLKALWADGWSAADIGFELFSSNGHRSAVLGKIHRLGLARKATGARSGRKQGQRFFKGEKAQPREKHLLPPGGVRPDARTEGGRRDERQRLPSGNLPPLPYDDEADAAMALEIPVEQRKTFQQLAPTHCHWPVGHPGTPEFFFCGGDRASDASPPYCDHHRRLAVARTPERKGQGIPYRMLRHNP